MNDSPLHVLMVEDSPTDAKLVIRALRKTFPEVVWERVEDAGAMRAALGQRQWDVIVSDWSMPRFSGLRALAVLQESGLDIPFIIVSGTVGEDVAVSAMRAGAQDYVLKRNLARLAAAVEREVQERAIRKAHREVAEALGASEARFARLAESGIIGICTMDVFGQVHEANDAYLGIVGYSAEEWFATKAKWTDVTPPEWRGVDEAMMDDLRELGVARPREKELLRQDGTRVPVLVGAAMLDYPNCIAFLADLTDRKQAEAALRRSEEKLRQAQRLEAMGSLAGGIAHDFNNLLSVILSYSALLAEDLANDDGKRGDLQEIHSAALRAADLTRQLLAFSRRQVLQPRLVNLATIVAGVETMLRRVIGEDIELVTRTEPDLLEVAVDPGQMEQVIVNLVVNARDAMPEGGRVTIRTSNMGATHVMLVVEDTGTGIDEETQSRMFEPFFTTKPEHQGTGLGLATVLGIIEQSEGRIDVRSAPGEGTEFTILLPASGPDPSWGSAIASVRELVHGTETILLVEDDDAVRGATRTVLQRCGFEVHEAATADEALQICATTLGRIDLLLTDVVMPELSGVQVARRVRASCPDVKVLFMSGHTDDVVLRTGASAEDFAFLHKPIAPDALVTKVREVLDSPGPRSGADRPG